MGTESKNGLKKRPCTTRVHMQWGPACLMTWGQVKAPSEATDGPCCPWRGGKEHGAHSRFIEWANWKLNPCLLQVIWVHWSHAPAPMERQEERLCCLSYLRILSWQLNRWKCPLHELCTFGKAACICLMGVVPAEINDAVQSLGGQFLVVARALLSLKMAPTHFRSHS